VKALLSAFGVLALTLSAAAAVVHDEGSDGDLSSNELNPTALVFAVGGNTVIGAVSNVAGVDRDFVTFTIALGQSLTALNLLAYSPDNLGFAAFNAGTTSYIPSGTTAGNFLAGIHPSGTNVGTDLLPLFVSSSVTGNSLPAPSLGPGDYCFMIQQTSPITTSYSLEFVVQQPVPTTQSAWGRIKALFE
jgi:hypothetical protein